MSASPPKQQPHGCRGCQLTKAHHSSNPPFVTTSTALVVVLACLSVLVSPVMSNNCTGQFNYGDPGLVDCTNIIGSLKISSTTATNLSSFSMLKSVSGDVEIYYNDDMLSLGGLEELQSIGGKLIISSNSQLMSLEGLDMLQSIGGYLQISYSDQLTSLKGLGMLQSIGGNLQIQKNGNLTSLQGLDMLQSISGNLQIYDNLQLTSLQGLGMLQSIGGSLEMDSNNQLTSLQGLGMLQSIGGYLSIMFNDQLTSLQGLDMLQSIGGYLEIQGNGQLTSLQGLGMLQSIGYFLQIIENPQLKSLDGLNALKSSGDVIIVFNPELISLDGLAALQKTTMLVLGGTDKLTSLSGLEQLATIETGLSIPAPWDVNAPNQRLLNFCALCATNYSGGAPDDILPDFRTNGTFIGENAWANWTAAGKPCAVGPFFCSDIPPSPSPIPIPSPTPSATANSTRVSQSPVPCPSPSPDHGSSTTPQTPSQAPTTSPISLPSPSTGTQCLSDPPFPGVAQCVAGEWIYEPPSGEILITEDAIVVTPMRVRGNLVIRDPASIIVRVDGRDRNSPLITVEGDLELGGTIVVEIDQADDGDFIALYQVSGTADEKLGDVVLHVNQPKECTQYEGKVETRGTTTVGVVVVTSRQKHCGSSAASQSHNSLAWALAIVLIIACFGA